jgi:hypothetical protein
MYDFLNRFLTMDRRWIFVGMALSILFPMLVPISCGTSTVEKRVQDLFDSIEAIETGSTVLVSADFDPASRPELEPFYRANLHHLFRKDVKIVMITLWEFAPALVVPIMEEIAEEYGKEYGKDWAFLGYKPGKELAIKAIGENIPKTFPTDDKGTKTVDLPIMDGFRQAKDFAMIVSISAGFPGTREYVLQIQGQYDLDIVAACTAVSGPDYIPFYKADQLTGLVAGMPAAAQYEQLVFPAGPPPGVRLLATQGVNVLNLGHAFIILLILFGNIAYFLTKPSTAPSRGKGA